MFRHLYYSYILLNRNALSAFNDQLVLLRNLVENGSLPNEEATFDPFVFKRAIIMDVLLPSNFARIGKFASISEVERACFPPGRLWGSTLQKQSRCVDCCGNSIDDVVDEWENIGFSDIIFDALAFTTVSAAVASFERSHYLTGPDPMRESHYCRFCERKKETNIRLPHVPYIIQIAADDTLVNVHDKTKDFDTVDKQVVFAGSKYRLFSISYRINRSHFAARIIRKVGQEFVYLQYDGMNEFGITQVVKCETEDQINNFCSWKWFETKNLRNKSVNRLIGCASVILYVNESFE